MTETKKNIYELISTISQEAGALGKEKKQGSGVPFAFRGIDDVINHLSPLLNKYGVITVPTVVDKVTSTWEVGAKQRITQSDLTMAYTFYAPDGSSVIATVPGLAQDYSDRSAAQAASVALRIALLQTFTLPTDSPDPEEGAAKVAEVIEASQKKQAVIDAQAPKAAPAEGSVEGVREQIKSYIDDPDTPYTGTLVNNLAAQITGLPQPKWWNSLPQLKKVLDAVSKGELPAED